MKKRKLYIIHSEYVQHGMTFNSNDEMLTSDSYKTQKSGRKGSKFFYCFYKYQPMVSNFSVEMKSTELE